MRRLRTDVGMELHLVICAIRYLLRAKERQKEGGKRMEEHREGGRGWRGRREKEERGRRDACKVLLYSVFTW